MGTTHNIWVAESIDDEDVAVKMNFMANEFLNFFFIRSLVGSCRYKNIQK